MVRTQSTRARLLPHNCRLEGLHFKLCVVCLCAGTTSICCSSYCSILYVVCMADAVWWVYSLPKPNRVASYLPDFCRGLAVRQTTCVYLVHPVWRMPLSGVESIHCNEPHLQCICVHAAHTRLNSKACTGGCTASTGGCDCLTNRPSEGHIVTVRLNLMPLHTSSRDIPNAWTTADEKASLSVTCSTCIRLQPVCVQRQLTVFPQSSDTEYDTRTTSTWLPQPHKN